METESKFTMQTDWIIQEPIDFEHKKYKLLDYFVKIDKLIDQNKLYPTFTELSLHLASLQTLVKENVILYTDKKLMTFDEEVLLKDLKTKELPIFSPEDIVEMSNIITYSSDKFLDYFNIVKSYWSLIYEGISISIKRNKKSLNLGVGYMVYNEKKSNKLYLWEYQILQTSQDIFDPSVKIDLIYCGNKSGITFNNIINEYSSFSSKGKREYIVFELKSDVDYPIRETLIPLFKRKLLSYNMQSVKIETIKKFEA